MHYTSSAIESLISRFEARSLPRAEWTHEAHLAVAIWYNSLYDDAKAMTLVRDFITYHNASVGTPNSDSEGYHETITRFWMSVGRQYLGDHGQASLAATVDTFIQSPYGQKVYPLSYYREETLFSVKARRGWVEPDLRRWGNNLHLASHRS